MALPDSATQHRAAQQRLTAQTILAARSTWSRLTLGDLDRSWQTIGPRLLVLVAAAQRAAATAGVAYIDEALDEQGITVRAVADVDAAALVGVASDGRPLDSLLYQPIIDTKVRIANGAAAEVAASGAVSMLERIVATQVADAGRIATGIGITARPRVGYVRMLVTPSCSRCVVLAGKYFKWNQGFQRHPLCDCRHIPTTENVADDLTTDPRKAIEAGQVTGLSKADTRAIVEDGADVGQVINAQRGLKAGGTTTEGTTRRGFAARRMQEAGDTFKGARTSRYARTTGARLTPEAIYREASSRDEALSLLRRYGYLV